MKVLGNLNHLSMIYQGGGHARLTTPTGLSIALKTETLKSHNAEVTITINKLRNEKDVRLAIMEMLGGREPNEDI